MQVQVINENLHLEEICGPVTNKMTRASLTAQLQLQLRWSRFLKQPSRLSAWAKRRVHWLKTAGQIFRSPGPQATKRLLNIEMSHLELLRNGVLREADWILILEDDAFSQDVSDCASGFAAIMTSESFKPKYVNVSQSFSATELGITHLLRIVEGSTWQGSATRTLLAADRPVTNTVCAILYRGDFAAKLLSAIGDLPLEPVVPIDWKLNLALMELFSTGELVPGDCWLVDPAPIVQMSMHTME